MRRAPYAGGRTRILVKKGPVQHLQARMPQQCVGKDLKHGDLHGQHTSTREEEDTRKRGEKLSSRAVFGRRVWAARRLRSRRWLVVPPSC